MIELNKLYNEDCLDGMKRIDDKSVDMILCDLPYGVTSCKWDIKISLDKLWYQYRRIIKDNGAIVLFGIEPFSSHLRMSNLKEYKHEWVWDKQIAANFVQAKKHPLKITENIIVFCKKKEETKQQNVDDKYFVMASGKFQTEKDESFAYPKNILTFNKFANECNSRKRIHPTQKPVALCEYLIKTYTNKGETILDNCMGSGTTAIACMNTNRNYIGFEMDTTYYELATKRIEQHIQIKS